MCIISSDVFASVESKQAQAKTLKIGYYEHPPNQYTNEDGEAVGYDIDYLSSLLDAANIEYEFFAYPWKRVIRLIKTGKLDVAMAAANIEERQAYAHFSNEVFTRGDNVLLVHEKYEEEFRQLTSLEELIFIPHKIGVTRGSSYSDEYDLLLSNAAFTNRLLQVNSIDQALNLALRDRIAGFITSLALAKYELNKHCGQARFFIAYNLLGNENNAAYLMYSKETVNIELVRKVDKIMQKIKRAPAESKDLNSICPPL